MAYKNDKPKKPNPEGIFEERKKEKGTAQEVLKKAHSQEKEKLKDGFAYIMLPDNKTRVLRKI